VLPGSIKQTALGQQSASFEHAPPLSTQVLDAQTKPPSAGMHGFPLQQLALDAHMPPGPTHAPVHRGTPRRSGLHVAEGAPPSQAPLQQSHPALHVESLQMSPSGLQPTGNRQTPVG
jgi:hypothetical protein